MGASYTTQWFTACRKDDIYLVKKLMGHFTCHRDKKSILIPNNERFVGFTGLLYACYANALSVVKELLFYEHALAYEGGGELEVPAPGIGQNPGPSTFIIRPGTTCLHLAVLRGNYEVSQWILEQLTGRPGALGGLRGRQDMAGLATLDALSIQTYPAAFSTFRTFKNYFLEVEAGLERAEGLNPGAFAAFFDNKPFLTSFLALTTHSKYGPILQNWFRHINVDTGAVLIRHFGNNCLASQAAINQNLALIRLMQAGDPPPLPDWLLASTSQVTTSSTLNKNTLNSFLTSPYQTVTLRSSNRKAFTLTSNFYTSNHTTNQTEMQKTLNTASTREVEVTPRRNRRYELFTDVYASPHSQSAINLRNKYITIIDDDDKVDGTEDNVLKGNNQINPQKHNLRMCDFHRSFEANSDFSDTEDSQQLVLDD